MRRHYVSDKQLNLFTEEELSAINDVKAAGSLAPTVKEAIYEAVLRTVPAQIPSEARADEAVEPLIAETPDRDLNWKYWMAIKDEVTRRCRSLGDSAEDVASELGIRFVKYNKLQGENLAKTHLKLACCSRNMQHAVAACGLNPKMKKANSRAQDEETYGFSVSIVSYDALVEAGILEKVAKDTDLDYKIRAGRFMTADGYNVKKARRSVYVPIPEKLKRTFRLMVLGKSTKAIATILGVTDSRVHQMEREIATHCEAMGLMD